MTHVITRGCCNDASCVAVCPVNCIHPLPGTPEFLAAEMLYIDPEVCIDCGACVEACPVEAAKDELDLEPQDEVFLQINASFFAIPRDSPNPARATSVKRDAVAGLRVAIVGAGAAGCFTALRLLRHPGVTVDMFERDLVPFGLVRFGVAPDHQDTKAVAAVFEQLANKPGFTLHLGVEVGRDVAAADLDEAYHAVVYATGASEPRALTIPGSDLPGVVSAASVYGWYNSAIERHGDAPPVSDTVVVIGTGNVALDVARVLLGSRASLAGSDVAESALVHLDQRTTSRVELLGRRGPEHAAFSTPELVGLQQAAVQIQVEPQGVLDATLARDDLDPLVRGKLELLAEMDRAGRSATTNQFLVMRFWTAPLAVEGQESAEGVRVRTDAPGAPAVESVIDTRCVIASIGLTGTPTEGVPFDHGAGTIPTDDYRVMGPEGSAFLGRYAVGWAANGSSGGIGVTKAHAESAASQIESDFASGAISAASERVGVRVASILAELEDAPLGMEAWKAIDAHEQAIGESLGRPRVKLLTRRQIRDVVAGLN